MKLLAIGAHPDDLEIYCFGALMAWKEMGTEVALAVATDGAAGGINKDGTLDRVRKAESIKALSGISKAVHFLGLSEDGFLPDRSLIASIRRLIELETPDLIVTHDPNDYHADHRTLSAAVSNAVEREIPVLYMDTLTGAGFHPTHYIDTTKFADAKAAAIRCHISQHPERYIAISEAQSALRAQQCNALPGAHAEAFKFEPRFPFADIRAYLPAAPLIRPIKRLINN